MATTRRFGCPYCCKPHESRVLCCPRRRRSRGPIARRYRLPVVWAGGARLYGVVATRRAGGRIADRPAGAGGSVFRLPVVARAWFAARRCRQPCNKNRRSIVARDLVGSMAGGRLRQFRARAGADCGGNADRLERHRPDYRIAGRIGRTRERQHRLSHACGDCFAFGRRPCGGGDDAQCVGLFPDAVDPRSVGGRTNIAGIAAGDYAVDCRLHLVRCHTRNGSALAGGNGHHGNRADVRACPRSGRAFDPQSHDYPAFVGTSGRAVRERSRHANRSGDHHLCAFDARRSLGGKQNCLGHPFARCREARPGAGNYNERKCDDSQYRNRAAIVRRSYRPNARTRRTA